MRLGSRPQGETLEPGVSTPRSTGRGFSLPVRTSLPVEKQPRDIETPGRNIETPARGVEAPEKHSVFFSKFSIRKRRSTENFENGAEKISRIVEEFLESAEEFG
jgi:hypothetical protein